MYGNNPVRLLYNIPVRLSANALKQIFFPTELSSSSTMTFGPCLGGPTLTQGSDRLFMLLSLLMGAACSFGSCWSDGGARGCRFVVLQIPWWGRFMWPFTVAGLGLRYHVTPLAVRLGHPLRNLHHIAFRSVDGHRLHRDWWANLMLLALVWMVWVNNPSWFDGGGGFSDCVAFPPSMQALVVAHMGTASTDSFEMLVLLVVSKNSLWRLTNGSCSSVVSVREVLPAGPTIGRVQRSVAGSFIPIKIFFPCNEPRIFCYQIARFIPLLWVHGSQKGRQWTAREQCVQWELLGGRGL